MIKIGFVLFGQILFLENGEVWPVDQNFVLQLFDSKQVSVLPHEFYHAVEVTELV